MTLATLIFSAMSCLVATTVPAACLPLPSATDQAPSATPTRTGAAVDVILTAEAALAWDVSSGEVIYTKAAAQRRPVASLTKLLSLLYIQEKLPPNHLVTIPPAAATAARSGANIRLPVGEHASVEELMAASAIASANDAQVSLALAVSGSEEQFVADLNQYAATIGLTNTKAANATGLSGGEQYSTASDIRFLLTRAAASPRLSEYLRKKAGSLQTLEGTKRAYTSTNQLLETYLAIVAAKTGYTVEAGENVAVITTGPARQELGVVILGSTQRFQDAKVLTEWIWRNYTWPQN